MLTWRYALTWDGEEYAVREVYNMDGSYGWTENPVKLTGDTPDEIWKDIEFILNDSHEGVLDISDPAKPVWKESESG